MKISREWNIIFPLIFAILGGFGGIFRLILLNQITFFIDLSFIRKFDFLFNIHEFLIVFGFVGCIISLERFLAIKVVSKRPRYLTDSHFSFLVIGTFMIIFGFWIPSEFLRTIGFIFYFIGLIIFFLYHLWLQKLSPHMKIPLLIMSLGITVMIFVTIFLMFQRDFTTNTKGVLWLSFPIIFILGERLELTKYSLKSNLSLIDYIPVFNTIGLIFLLFLIQFVDSIILFNLIFISFISLIIIVARADISIKSSEPESINQTVFNFNMSLSNYLRFSTRLAYSWGVLGCLILLYHLNLGSEPIFIYDAGLHALAVGLIGTMILAHGPIVLPAVLNKPRPIKVNNLGLIIFTLATVIRVSIDLVYSIFGLNFLNFLGLTGILLLFAIILYLFLTIRVIIYRQTEPFS